MSYLHLIEPSRFPAEDDVVGQIALALAVHDVTEPPRAMTSDELEAFNKLMDSAWNDRRLRLYHYELREFQAHEQGAHAEVMKGGSFPIHYGMNYWREYLDAARIALDVALRVYGQGTMKAGKHDK